MQSPAVVADQHPQLVRGDGRDDLEAARLAGRVCVDDGVGQGLRGSQPDLLEPLPASARRGRDVCHQASGKRHCLGHGRVGLIEDFRAGHPEGRIPASSRTHSQKIAGMQAEKMRMREAHEWHRRPRSGIRAPDRGGRVGRAGRAASVQRGGQPAPSIPCQRVLDAQIVKHPDHHAPYVVARSVGIRQRADQQIERALLLAGVERGERLA